MGGGLPGGPGSRKRRPRSSAATRKASSPFSRPTFLRWGAKRLRCHASRYMVGPLKCNNEEWTPFAPSGVERSRIVFRENVARTVEKRILDSREDCALDRDRYVLRLLCIS